MISNFYGSTEMYDVTFETFTCLHDVLAKANYDKIPIGVPVDNTKAYLLDDNLDPVLDGATGNLYISGRNLGDGYVGAKKGSFMPNNLSQSEEDPDNGPVSSDYGVLYKTGDYAKIYKGRLYYEGRCDAQVKVRGHRVDLSEIEQAVAEVSGVKTLSVLCFKPGDQQQKILCYYTIEDKTTLPESTLENILTSKLPDYMMPKLVKLTSLPLLVNGKTDRQALLKRDQNSLECTAFTFTDKDVALYVANDKFSIAKVVLESVASVIVDSDHKPTLNDNFFDIGGDSINMVLVIAKINDHGYHISVTDFATSDKLLDVVDLLSTDPMTDSLTKAWEKLKKRNDFSSEDLKPEHKDKVLDMISRSFAEKGDLTTLADVTYNDLMEQLEMLWFSLLEANLSIVITNKEGVPVGACLNFDANSEEAAPLCACSAVSRNLPETMNDEVRDINENGNNNVVGEVPLTVVDFLNAIEEPLKKKHVPEGRGKFIYTSLLGTDKNLSTAENVQVVMYMEQENIRLGKTKGFKGVFTTNANRLTQLISRSLEYTILASIQINQYEDVNGTRPFHEAPDDLVTEIAIKWF